MPAKTKTVEKEEKSPKVEVVAVENKPVIVEGSKEVLALSDEELYINWANERDTNPEDTRVLALLQALALSRGIRLENWEARYTAE